VVFASSVAAIQACFVALIGVEPLQWSKLCNIYTRFCVQGAFGMVCGLAAAVAMAVLSASPRVTSSASTRRSAAARRRSTSSCWERPRRRRPQNCLKHEKCMIIRLLL
jgi:hypothetical protein